MKQQQHELQIRKYSPGTFQSDEAIIEQFVVRQRELATVHEVLRDNIDSPSCQHILVVAPHGRGKSMLLARVAAELRTNSEYSEHLLAVRFMEESQEIFNIADFWLETLFYLARELAPSDPEFSRELEATHKALTGNWNAQGLDKQALARVLDAADRLGRKLVLMVENLQALCDDTDSDFGWQLRKVLQSENQIMLLATATSRFEALEDAQEPFFELFRVLYLDPLDTEECQRLWAVISDDAVSERDIRPLQILTGGSPRLLVIVAGFARHRSLRQLMEELVQLIDDHTEYFRGHLETLPKAERRVYLALIDLWQPSSTGEIAARARMDVRAVSTFLGRLVKRGVVIVEGSGRKRLYAAAERLYSIYYKLRRERDEAAVVRNLIQFMVAFYSRPEFGDAPKNHPLKGIETTDRELGHPYRDSGKDLAVVEIAARLLEKAMAQGQLGDSAAEIATYDEVIERFAASDDRELLVRVAMALVNKGDEQVREGHAEDALSTAEIVEQQYGHLVDSEAVHFDWWAKWLKIKVSLVLERFDDVLPLFQSLYASFDPGNRAMMQAMLDNLPELIGKGADGSVILEVLSSDKDKCDSIVPLVVAIRQEVGEAVRAPAEVLAVAADVRQRIADAR